jgi:lipoprotein-anchoring transpeptidase ErfK/SrfK
VQVALDRAGFRPGKIDGLGGEFTQKAADRLNQSLGLPLGTLVDTSGISSPYRYYEVTEEDLKWIGKTASSPPEQQKLKRMPYADAWEMLAEMFHCDLNFLRELNPSLTNSPIVAGTSARVPDVEPFRMADVTALEKSRSEAAKAAAAPTPAPSPTFTQPAQSELTLAPAPSPDFLLGDPSAQLAPLPEPTPMPTPEPPKRRIVLLTGPRILELYEGDRLIASYPCTPGSGRVPVPVGEWRITANILMPYFRYDKSVLKDGTRSANAFNIPPGPNNYVGIVWMAINRPSVGIHGTQSPDQIGRNESSGCIRLANWDAFDLSQKITKGTPVTVLRNAEATP